MSGEIKVNIASANADGVQVEHTGHTTHLLFSMTMPDGRVIPVVHLAVPTSFALTLGTALVDVLTRPTGG